MFEKCFTQDVRHNLRKIYPNEGIVANYGNRIRVKYTAKRGIQIVGMIFQTRSNTSYITSATSSNISSVSISVSQFLTFDYLHFSCC